MYPLPFTPVICAQSSQMDTLHLLTWLVRVSMAREVRCIRLNAVSFQQAQGVPVTTDQGQ
jgi:hypothetical protein